MPDIDQALRRLGDLPVPEALESIDDAVFAGLAAGRHEAHLGSRAMGLAAAFALMLGITAGRLTGEDAAAQALSPFAADNPLAPSTLLDVHP